MTGADATPTTTPYRQLLLIAAVQVLAMATWFSASAVVPALRTEWGISPGAATWLTAAVQIGFVAGAVSAAVLNLPDRVPAHLLVAGSALLAATTTATIAVAVDGLAAAMVLRFFTGVALAGVYHPASSSWRPGSTAVAGWPWECWSGR